MSQRCQIADSCGAKDFEKFGFGRIALLKKNVPKAALSHYAAFVCVPIFQSPVIQDNAGIETVRQRGTSATSAVV